MKFVVLGLALLCSVAAISSSCGKSPAESAQDGEEILSDPAKFDPGASPGWKAQLVLSGSPLDVDVKQEKSGTDLTLRLFVLDQEIEVERYRSTPSRFQLLQAASERFEPPLTLLEYPVREGQTLNWDGQLEFADLERKATAKVVAKKEQMNVPGYNDWAVKVSVNLEIESGGPKPANRVLNFWFVQGKGVLKREFDKGSTRIPAPPGVPSEGKAN